MVLWTQLPEGKTFPAIWKQASAWLSRHHKWPYCATTRWCAYLTAFWGLGGFLWKPGNKEGTMTNRALSWSHCTTARDDGILFVGTGTFFRVSLEVYFRIWQIGLKTGALNIILIFKKTPNFYYTIRRLFLYFDTPKCALEISADKVTWQQEQLIKCIYLERQRTGMVKHCLTWMPF